MYASSANCARRALEGPNSVGPLKGETALYSGPQHPHGISLFTSSGCDIVVCLDGNFNHRHLAGRGDCPPFWMPRFFLSKAYVDKVGEAIEHARKHTEKSEEQKKKRGRKKGGAKKGQDSEQADGCADGQRDSKSAPTVTDRVPDEAVDDCEKSHKAGSGSTVKTYMELFDDAGVMALVCRHDIPLVAANIDTPGEQQKYAVALIQHLFSLIPDTATVTVLYDVGCVLNRSREKVSKSVVSLSVIAETPAV